MGSERYPALGPTFSSHLSAAESLQAIVRKAIAGALQDSENAPEPEQPAKVKGKRKVIKPIEVIPVEEEEIPAAKPRRRVEIR